MRKVILVRHGAVEGRVPGQLLHMLPYPLSHVGILQAARIVASIHGTMDVKRIFTSEAFRCIQTAMFIQKGASDLEHARGLEPIVIYGLAERHYGGVEREEDIYPKDVDDGWDKYRHKPGQGGESLQEVQARVHRFVEEELTEGDVIVSHELILRMLMTAISTPPKKHDEYTFNEVCVVYAGCGRTAIGI